MYTNVDCVIHTRLMSIYLYSLYIGSIYILIFFLFSSLVHFILSMCVVDCDEFIYEPYRILSAKTLFIYRQINDVNCFCFLFFLCLCGVCATSHRRWHQEKTNRWMGKSMKKQVTDFRIQPNQSAHTKNELWCRAASLLTQIHKLKRRRKTHTHKIND